MTSRKIVDVVFSLLPFGPSFPENLVSFSHVDSFTPAMANPTTVVGVFLPNGSFSGYVVVSPMTPWRVIHEGAKKGTFMADESPESGPFRVVYLPAEALTSEAGALAYLPYRLSVFINQSPELKKAFGTEYPIRVVCFNPNQPGFYQSKLEFLKNLRLEDLTLPKTPKKEETEKMPFGQTPPAQPKPVAEQKPTPQVADSLRAEDKEQFEKAHQRLLESALHDLMNNKIPTDAQTVLERYTGTLYALDCLRLMVIDSYRDRPQ